MKLHGSIQCTIYAWCITRPIYMQSSWLINHTVDQLNLLTICCLIMHLRHPTFRSYMD